MMPLAPPGAGWAFKVKRAASYSHIFIAILFVLGLWRADYPAWRTAAVAVLLFANLVRNLVFKHMLLPVKVMERPEDCPRTGTTIWLLGVFSQFVIAGLTGGLRSPFLIATIPPLSGILVTFGWSRESKAAMKLAIVGALALILLPSSWLGPTVAEPYYAQLIGLTLFATVFLHSAYVIAMTKALHESRGHFDRARDQRVHEAMARARELEQLSAQLSHELKNPLGAIKALVQLSRKDACDEKSAERLKVAESEVERMGCILQEYLSFSRPLEKLRRERLSLASLADEVIDLLGAQASGAGVALRRSGESSIEADPRRLREALFNLVANALDATPRGGSVEVRIVQSDGHARVEVRDSGRGMPPDVLERVGTPFFTTREQGTGLGVAMARAAFTQHGGSLEYDSEEGRGTVATGTLPLRLEGRPVGAAAAG